MFPGLITKKEAVDIIDGMLKKLKSKPENTFLADYKASGGLENLEAKWFAEEEPTEFLDCSTLEGKNGTLKVAFNASYKPFTYVKNGQYAGFDIELITIFAEEYGYKLEFEDVSFGVLLSGISLGTYDIGASGITISEERRESVDYSDSYYTIRKN